MATPEKLVRTDALLGPGIHEDVPEAEYHALPYASNSRLTLLKRSPAHLKADLDRPREPTPSMLLGTAIHAAVLEPEKFAAVYVTSGQCEGVKKDRERCTYGGSLRVDGAWWCQRHAPDGTLDDCTVLSPDDRAACLGVRDSIRRHPKLAKLLDAPGRTELTVVWDDAVTGVRCKARIDRLSEIGGGVSLDLKSTRDARPHAFERAVAQFGYYRQKAMYRDGLRASGVDTEHLVIIAAEKEPPFAVAGYRLSDGAADMGRTELRTLLARYAECLERGEWPGYDTDILELSLPAWAWSDIDTEG